MGCVGWLGGWVEVLLTLVVVPPELAQAVLSPDVPNREGNRAVGDFFHVKAVGRG